MTTKDYLRQVQLRDERLKLEREKLERLRAAVEYRSPAFEGGGCRSLDRSEIIDRLADREYRYEQMAAEYIAFYDEVNERIGQIGDSVLSEVLERRYLLYQKWEDIAAAMHRDLRWVYRLHGKALEKLTIESH